MDNIKKKHLIFLLSSLGWKNNSRHSTGGTENFSVALLNYWIVRGYRITLIVFYEDSENFFNFHPDIKIIFLGKHLSVNSQQSSVFCNISSNIKLKAKKIVPKILLDFKREYIIKKKNKKKNKKIYGLFKIAIQDISPDIIISFGEATFYVGMKSGRDLNIPLLLCVRNDHRYDNLLRSDFFKKICSKNNRVKFVFQTSETARYFNITDEKIKIIIPNFIFHSAEKYFYRPVKTISSVGRLELQKDHRTLIYAFKLIHNYYPDIQLIIYGEGELRGDLETLVMNLNLTDKIFLPGYKKDIIHQLLKSDLFILPSLYEGMSNALADALCVGLPVISSDYAGNRVLITDKVNGRLFPIEDSVSLAKIMQELIQDTEQRIRLGKAARLSVEKFSPEKILPLWDNVLDKMFP